MSEACPASGRWISVGERSDEMPSASDIVESAARGTRVVGWKLEWNARRVLLNRFPPRFRNLVADHVVLAREVAEDTPLPGEDRGKIIGRAHDGRGIEALIIAIGGTSDRPGGGIYHITWSLADGHRNREPGEMLDHRNWVRFGVPIPVQLVPASL
jgi:hypothetical protein